MHPHCFAAGAGGDFALGWPSTVLRWPGTSYARLMSRCTRSPRDVGFHQQAGCLRRSLESSVCHRGSTGREPQRSRQNNKRVLRLQGDRRPTITFGRGEEHTLMGAYTAVVWYGTHGWMSCARYTCAIVTGATRPHTRVTDHVTYPWMTDRECRLLLRGPGSGRRPSGSDEVGLLPWSSSVRSGRSIRTGGVLGSSEEHRSGHEGSGGSVLGVVRIDECRAPRSEATVHLWPYKPAYGEWVP